MKGEFVLAVKDCKASIKIRPKYSYAYNNLGTAYLGMGKFAAAITALNKAIELRPNYFWSRLNRAKAYAAIGKKKKQCVTTSLLSHWILKMEKQKNR